MQSILNKPHARRDLILTIGALAVLLFVVLNIPNWFDAYIERIFILSTIYAICALSMNLINGFTGLFTLGQPGFMAIGAYVYALLTISPQTKQALYYVEPIVPWLADIQLNPWIAVIAAGIVAAFFAFLIGFPVLQLKGDYLAIASLGFAEIIRLLITNCQSLTNGPSGLKSIPGILNVGLALLILAIVTVLLLLLINSPYGRAYKAIREDEVAAGAVGVHLFRYKIQAFMISGFMAGLGGALLASVLGTIDPNQFKFTLVYQLLLMVILGGQGSVSGSIAGAFIITIGLEVLRFLDEPINFGFFRYPGISGMRMVVFSVILMFILLFWKSGIFGDREFSWERLLGSFRKKQSWKSGGKEEAAK